MTKRAIAIEGVIAGLAVIVAVYVHQRTERWDSALAVGLFAEILLQVFRFRAEYGPFLAKLSDGFDNYDHPFKVLTHLSLRTMPIELLTNRPLEPIFQAQFERLIADLRQNLESLEQGKFVVPMEGVQDASFRVSDSLERSAFCTAPQDNLNIFMSRRGGELKKSNFEAAERLKDLGGFTRLFVFANMSSIQREYFNLMEENSKSGVTVLVALSPMIDVVLRKYKWGGRGDFGLWDDEYLITILKTEEDGPLLMEVSKEEDLLETARSVVEELKETAWSWEDFWREFVAPVSEEQWSTTPERLLELDAPNGPSTVDCAVMRDCALEVLEPGDRLAVYGLTAPLIESVSNIATTISREVVDCRIYRGQMLNDGFDYIQANWLQWQPQDEYKVILGDDVIPNLGIWQVPLFFRCLFKAMAPGGRFITRTAAMYAPDTIHPTWTESLNKLRLFDPNNGNHIPNVDLSDLVEGVVYEVAWPALHGSEFYEETCHCIDLSKWDKKLQLEADDADFRAKARLPCRHTITSLDYGLLKELAAPFFQVVDERPVFSNWESDERLWSVPGAKDIADRFREYYRILVFERLANNGSLISANDPDFISL